MTIMNGKHDFKAQSIYGDACVANRVRRLVGEVVERRIRDQRMGGNGSDGRVTNAPSLARPTWQEGGGEDDLDDRRSIWDECGYPATRSMTPQRWQTLNDRDAVAGTVNEVMARYAWQVTPFIFEKEQGKVVTAFDKGLRQLSQQLRFGGMPDHFGELGGGPLEEVMERASALCGVGRFGVIVYGLNDGLSWEQPVPGAQEEGSKPGEQQIDAKGQPVVDDKGQPVVNVDRGDTRRYVLNWASPDNPELMEQTQGRKLGYVNAFSEAMVRPNRFETNKESPRFLRPVSYQITFQDPKNPIWGVGVPMSTQQVHWTRVQHICDTVDHYSNGVVFGTPRCQPVLNNVMALAKLYHGGPEGFWKYALPYLFLTTHPQLGGDVEIDDEGLRDMIEEMMNGLQKAGILTGMDAKMVGGNFADPTAQIAVHLEAIAMKKRMPVRILKGSERGELSSAQDDDAWDDQVVRYQTGWVTNNVVRPCTNLLCAYGVVPMPETPSALKVAWPDVTSMSAEAKTQVAQVRMTALSTYLNGGGGNALTLFDFMVNEWNYTQEQALAAIKNVSKANGYDLAQTGLPDDLLSDGGDGLEQIEDYTPPEATEGEGEDAPKAEGEPGAVEPAKAEAPTGNEGDEVDNERMCWGKPCPDDVESAPKNVAATKAKLLSAHAAKTGEDVHHSEAAQAHDDAAKAHFEHYQKSGDPGSLHRIQEHAEAAAAHRAHLDATTTRHAPPVDPDKTIRTPEPKAATIEATLLRPPGKRVQ